MTFMTAKWTINEYHRMISADILCDRSVELLISDRSDESDYLFGKLTKMRSLFP